jgi:DNA-binding response OmpR family regulator
VHLVREGLRVSAIPADLVIASDGEQALRFLSEFNVKPGFIILDLNLPKFSGLELLERYRADERPPVVVLSGSENPRDKTRALELGASDYILKPFDYQEFIQLVRVLSREGAGARPTHRLDERQTVHVVAHKAKLGRAFEIPVFLHDDLTACSQ